MKLWRGGVVDPMEPWEMPYSEREGGFYYGYLYHSYAISPKNETDLPPGAKDLLCNLCEVESLDQMLVLPSCVRFIGAGNVRAITPTQVLAVGNKAIGLWTEKPEAGVKVVIKLEELAGIEDIEILLYGKLSFYSREKQLNIRYNTVDRNKIEPNLAKTRKSMWRTQQQVKCTDWDQEGLPYKWQYELKAQLASTEMNGPYAIAHTTSRKYDRRSKERSQMVVLNANEVILLRDSEYPMTVYGIERFIIPRERIGGARESSKALEIYSNGKVFVLPLAEKLRPVVLEWLA